MQERKIVIYSNDVAGSDKAERVGFQKTIKTDLFSALPTSNPIPIGDQGKPKGLLGKGEIVYVGVELLVEVQESTETLRSCLTRENGYEEISLPEH